MIRVPCVSSQSRHEHRLSLIDSKRRRFERSSSTYVYVCERIYARFPRLDALHRDYPKDAKGSTQFSLSFPVEYNINEATCLPWYEDARRHTHKVYTPCARACTHKTHTHTHTHTYAWRADKSSGELSLARDDVVSYLKKKKKKKNTCVRMKLENVEEGELIETINRLFRGFLVSPSIRTIVCSLPEAILNSTLDV